VLKVARSVLYTTSDSATLVLRILYIRVMDGASSAATDETVGLTRQFERLEQSTKVWLMNVTLEGNGDGKWRGVYLHKPTMALYVEGLPLCHVQTLMHVAMAAASEGAGTVNTVRPLQEHVSHKLPLPPSSLTRPSLCLSAAHQLCKVNRNTWHVQIARSGSCAGSALASIQQAPFGLSIEPFLQTTPVKGAVWTATTRMTTTASCTKALGFKVSCWRIAISMTSTALMCLCCRIHHH
jgi:hypothetical protein